MPRKTTLCFLFAAGCYRPAPINPSPELSGSHVRVARLAQGVYAAIRTEPLGMAVNSNSLFIVNDSDVFVVDAQFTRAATLETLAALRRITSKPVTVVFNTHWHDDHVAGNQVYQDSFPGVKFLATSATREDLVALGRSNRENQLKFMPQGIAQTEANLAKGLTPDEVPVSPGERASLESADSIARTYVTESAGYREVLPDTMSGRHMTLKRGKRRVDLYWFGRANTRGDLVINLPDDHIVAVGDLAGAPIPFGFNSFPTEWISVLDSVVALRPATVVMGHGPVMKGTAYLQSVRSALAEGRQQAEAAIKRGDKASAVTMDAARSRFAGSDVWLNRAFDLFFRQPVAFRLFQELKH